MSENLEKLQYPRDFINKILCGDSLKLMRQIPDESVDLIITSPPYNIRNSTGNGLKDIRGSKWANTSLHQGYSHHDDCMDDNEYIAWQRNCLMEMLRVIKNDGAIFYNHKWRVQNGLLQDRQEILKDFPLRQVIIWRRKGGFNFNSGYFLPIYEVVYLIAKQNFRLAAGANAHGDVWDFTQETRNSHPAAFPVGLTHRIVSSTDAQLILDPFMGSGTTAISALEFHRKFIGIDISPEYCAMANARISGYTSQRTFWDEEQLLLYR